MDKRGVIEVQFNWIFILIVGALIVALSTSIVVKQKSLSESSACATTLTNLETILVGSKISTSTLNVIDIPKTEIQFTCDHYSQCNIERKIRDKVIFSSDFIKGNKLITWALEWKAPFKVTNFLYLTSPLIRYILIGDDETSNKIYSVIPKEINKEFYSYDEFEGTVIDDLNNYKVKMVFFNPSDVSKIKVPFNLKLMGKDITAIEINGNEEIGDVKFYKNENGIFKESGSSRYLKRESLIGSIFVEDSVNYECTMEKAIKNLNIISNIYQKKSEKVYTNFEPTNPCYIYHFNSNIDKIQANSASFDTDTFDDLNEALHTVESQNRRLQLSSCPLIY